MAITTLDQIIAGFKPPIWLDRNAASATSAANQWKSLWAGAAAGFPNPVGTYDTTLNGVILSSSSAIPVGAIPHYDPVSGNAYLARLCMTAVNSTQIMLADRLWHNGGITITSTGVQALTSPSWPARDANGATTGVGVMLGVESSVSVGSGGTLTVKYTNTAGVSGQTATCLNSQSGLNATQNFGIFQLQSGDLGVQSVQSVQLGTSMLSGTINLVAFRVLMMLCVRNANQPESIDVLDGMTRLYNGTVPFFACYVPGVNTPRVQGTYQETWG